MFGIFTPQMLMLALGVASLQAIRDVLPNPPCGAQTVAVENDGKFEPSVSKV